MKTALRVLCVLIVLGTSGAGLYFWFEAYRIPTIREEVAEPLFTVASAEYDQALAEGKPVIQYGPLPGSAFYAGGLAFKQPEEALVWLKTTGKYDEGWRVYQLSGDFTLDTHLIRGLSFTNKTLLICKTIPVN